MVQKDISPPDSSGTASDLAKWSAFSLTKVLMASGALKVSKPFCSNFHW